MQKIIYTLLFVFVSQLAQAKLEIEIIQGNASALPIAIIPLQWRASDPAPRGWCGRSGVNRPVPLRFV